MLPEHGACVQRVVKKENVCGNSGTSGHVTDYVFETSVSVRWDMTDTPALPVAVLPGGARPDVEQAVHDGGGEVVSIENAEAIVMVRGDRDTLEEGLGQGMGVTWVQLPSAGIERYVDLLDQQHVWTCAKGIYGPSVAEHALALILAGIHQLGHFARLRTWSPLDYRPLLGGNVVLVGGGGIARDLIDLLQPFHPTITVVRPRPAPMDGTHRVVSPNRLHEVLPEADAVVLAPALTDETRGMIGVAELALMRRTAWLVNVGRGGLIQTDALVAALRDEQIGGAALDVTDPEPLPDDHPLWSLDNCLITPHVANPPSFERQAYARLVEENVRRRRGGEALEGLVDVRLGY